MDLEADRRCLAAFVPASCRISLILDALELSSGYVFASRDNQETYRLPSPLYRPFYIPRAFLRQHLALLPQCLFNLNSPPPSSPPRTPTPFTMRSYLPSLLALTTQSLAVPYNLQSLTQEGPAATLQDVATVGYATLNGGLVRSIIIFCLTLADKHYLEPPAAKAAQSFKLVRTRLSQTPSRATNRRLWSCLEL